MVVRDFEVYFPDIGNTDPADEDSEKFAHDNYEIGDYEFWSTGEGFIVQEEDSASCLSMWDGVQMNYNSFGQSLKPVRDTKLARIFHKNDIIEGNGKWLIIKI